MTDTAPCLISVDWGTTSLRCKLVDGDGTVLEQTHAERGILRSDGQPFADILLEQISEQMAGFADGVTVPVVMSGMIGSRQGWQEATYLRCPASPYDLAQGLSVIDTSGSPLARCDVRIVPGMDIGDDPAHGLLPDVMRGEETQVLGALLGAGRTDGVFVLPGTHSKWVNVEAGAITRFRTFMTGEVYAALLDATILGRLVEGEEDHEEGFARGIQTAASANTWAGPGHMLNLFFTARSRVLHGELDETAVRGYLSGLLIGAEIQSGAEIARAGSEAGDDQPIAITIIGEDALQLRYATAVSMLGGRSEPAVGDPVPLAHLAIARLAGLVP